MVFATEREALVSQSNDLELFGFFAYAEQSTATIVEMKPLTFADGIRCVRRKSTVLQLRTNDLTSPISPRSVKSLNDKCDC